MHLSRRRRPIGDWSISEPGLERALKVARKGSDGEFYVKGCERSTGVEIVATVRIADLEGMSEEEWGIRAGTPRDRIWNFQRLSFPRTTKSGGSSEVVNRVLHLADENDAWVFAQVDPIDLTRKDIILKMLARRGFRAPFAEAPHMVVRNPVSGG